MLSYSFSLFLLLCLSQEDCSFFNWDSPSDYLCKKVPCLWAKAMYYSLTAEWPVIGKNFISWKESSGIQRGTPHLMASSRPWILCSLCFFLLH